MSVDFKYTISKAQTVKIGAYIGDSEEVKIPGIIDGYPVVGFNKDIFKNNKTIKKVIWPTELKEIPKEIFFGCTALEEIVISDGVTTISEKAFRNCESLKKITIPASVTNIHEKAFECAKNTFLGWEYWNCITTIMGSFGSVAENFAKNMGIQFVSTNASKEVVDAISLYSFHEVDDGIALDDFVITDDMPKIKPFIGAAYLVDFEIPNEILGKPVVELSVDFHKSEKQVGVSGTKYDKIAENLIIPENLKRIRCPLEGRGIKTVNVLPGNNSIVFDEYAWYEDGGKTIVSSWVNYVSPGAINEYIIKDGTVRACKEMKQKFVINKLIFPNSFTEVHEEFLMDKTVFGEKFSHTKRIYANYDSCMREHAKEINADFIPLDKQEIVFSEDGTVLLSCSPIFPQETYRIPDGVKKIEAQAFRRNETLVEIIIPDSVEDIGEEAFLECEKLEKITLSNNIKYLPHKVFAGCEKLNSVKWSENLIAIGQKCFSGTGFEKLVLPESVQYIHDYAFAPYSAFNTDRHIKSIELPKSVLLIGKSICAGIYDIVIYDSIDTEAKPAKEFIDAINGHWNSRVGCMGIKQREGYVDGTCNSELFMHTITVKSAETDEVKYKVLMFDQDETRDTYCTMVSSWGKNAEFNFENLDAIFDNLKIMDNKFETAINRLEYPVDLTDEMKEKYLSWLKRNGLKVATYLIESGDIEKLLILGKYNAFSKSNIDKIIALSNEKGLEEITSYLVQYKTKM